MEIEAHSPKHQRQRLAMHLASCIRHKSRPRSENRRLSTIEKRKVLLCSSEKWKLNARIIAQSSVATASDNFYGRAAALSSRPPNDWKEKNIVDRLARDGACAEPRRQKKSRAPLGEREMTNNGKNRTAQRERDGAVKVTAMVRTDGGAVRWQSCQFNIHTACYFSFFRLFFSLVPKWSVHVCQVHWRSLVFRLCEIMHIFFIIYFSLSLGFWVVCVCLALERTNLPGDFLFSTFYFGLIIFIIAIYARSIDFPSLFVSTICLCVDSEWQRR